MNIIYFPLQHVIIADIGVVVIHLRTLSKIANQNNEEEVRMQMKSMMILLQLTFWSQQLKILDVYVQ